MKTTASTSARFSKLNKAVRAARQGATDFAFNNRPLSPAQVAEHQELVAVADAAQDTCDTFYAGNSQAVGGALKC